MKQIISIFALVLCACSSNNNINLAGQWIEVLPENVSYIQGMDLKEDGSQAQLDEKLSFKVIEFNKDAKRIILSHSRIFEDAAKAEEKAEKKATKKSSKKEEAPMIQNQAASTTLGDIDALAALKEQLEGKK